MAAIPESRLSLRLRIRAWNAAVITLTLAALTAAAIHQERQQLLRTERAHAEALLDHLAHMPGFAGDAQTAASRLALLRDSLGVVGSELELVGRERLRVSGTRKERRACLPRGGFRCRRGPSISGTAPTLSGYGV